MSTLEIVEDMVQDALYGGVAMQFVQWFLNLREADSRSTKGMQDLRSDWPRRGTRNGPCWTTLFSQSMWTRFLSLRKWCNGARSQHVDARLESLSGEQASLLAGTGLAHSRKLNIAEQSLLYAQKIVELAKDNTMVTWIDNYNKWRYSRNVARQRNISINATCVAMLPIAPSNVVPRFKGVKTVPECLGYCLPLGNSLLCCGRQFVPSVGRLTRYGPGTCDLTPCVCRSIFGGTM